MTIGQIPAGKSFVLPPGPHGTVFTVLEHVPGFAPLTVASSKGYRRGSKPDETTFFANQPVVPVSDPEPAPPSTEQFPPDSSAPGSAPAAGP